MSHTGKNGHEQQKNVCLNNNFERDKSTLATKNSETLGNEDFFNISKFKRFIREGPRTHSKCAKTDKHIKKRLAASEYYTSPLSLRKVHFHNF